jgi:hypothetical protein
MQISLECQRSGYAALGTDEVGVPDRHRLPAVYFQTGSVKSYPLESSANVAHISQLQHLPRPARRDVGCLQLITPAGARTISRRRVLWPSMRF